MGTVITPPIKTSSPTSILATVLNDIQLVTQVVSLVPSPVSAFAGLALELEQVAKAAINALAAAKGQTATEIAAQLHQETLVT